MVNFVINYCMLSTEQKLTSIFEGVEEKEEAKEKKKDSKGRKEPRKE